MVYIWAYGHQCYGKSIKNELNKTSKIPKDTYKKQVLLDFYNLSKIIDIILFKKINLNKTNN